MENKEQTQTKTNTLLDSFKELFPSYLEYVNEVTKDEDGLGDVDKSTEDQVLYAKTLFHAGFSGAVPTVAIRTLQILTDIMGVEFTQSDVELVGTLLMGESQLIDKHMGFNVKMDGEAEDKDLAEKVKQENISNNKEE